MSIPGKDFFMLKRWFDTFFYNISYNYYYLITFIYKYYEILISNSRYLLIISSLTLVAMLPLL